MGRACRLLTDPKLTAFDFVTLPEVLPIAVVTRLIQSLEDFGSRVGSVVGNMVVDRRSGAPEAAEFVKNRAAMQQEHMQTS